MWRSAIKGWWMNFIALIGAALFFLTASCISLFHHGLSAAIPYLAIAAIPAASAWLGLRRRMRKYGDGPTTDEREQWIRARAGSAAGQALLIAWGVATLVPYYYFTTQGQKIISLDVTWLPPALFWVAQIHFVVSQITMRLIRRRELSRAQV